MEVEAVEIKYSNFVVYTDGSGRSMLPGVSSCYACIGYVYSKVGDVPVSKATVGTNKDKVTDKGLLSTNLVNENPAFYHDAQPVEIEYSFAIRGNKEGRTNNYSELFAIYRALQYIGEYVSKDKPLGKVLIKSDSQTSIIRLEKAIKGQIENASYDEHTAKLIKDFYDLYNDLMDKFEQFELKIVHVFGHANSLGNQLADMIAYSCIQRTKEFEEVTTSKDFFKNVENNYITTPWFLPDKKYFIMSGNMPTFFLHRYDTKSVVGEKRGGTLVGLIRYVEKEGYGYLDYLPENIKGMITKYVKYGNPDALDVQINHVDLATPTNRILINICRDDSFDCNENNKLWFKICGKGISMVGKSLPAIGVKTYNNLEALLEQYKSNSNIFKIDIKEIVSKANIKEKVKIDIPLDLSNEESICGYKITDEMKKALTRIKALPLYPGLNIPEARFLLDMFKNCKYEDIVMELVINNVTENLMNAFVYISTVDYRREGDMRFDSIWSDLGLEFIFLK